MLKICTQTHGCKTNQYETEAILGKFIDAGFSLVDLSDDPDIILVNCCCVTNKAEAKSRRSIRKALKKKSANSRSPDLDKTKIIITGCFGEKNKKYLRDNKSDFTVFSNRNKPNIFSFATKGIRQDEVPPEVFPELSLQDSFQRTRVPIKIQDGCDFFCSYCILPIVRGKPVSRAPKKIVQEINDLVRSGTQEIILTGINLGLYGREFDDFKLANLLELISNQTEIKMIRLSSLEPMFFTKEFIDYLANNAKICPHFHISLQNGSDEILKLMHRNYTTNDFAATIKDLQNAIPNCAIGCDVIVGFPEETAEDFQKTYSFIESMNIAYLHVFRFSKRPGTKAAKMKNQVSENIKKTRMEKLIRLGEKKKGIYTRNLIRQEIPVRAVLERKEKDVWKAVSDHYVQIHLEDDNYENGQFVHVIPSELSAKSNLKESGRTRKVEDDVCNVKLLKC